MASVAAGLSRIITSPEFSSGPEKSAQPDLRSSAVSSQGHKSPDAITVEDTVTLSGFAPRPPKYPIPNPLAPAKPATTPAGVVVSTVSPEDGRSTALQNFGNSKNPAAFDKNLSASNNTIDVLPKLAATTVPQAANSVPTLSLQHLDETLQQIGINPLSISIARREALLSLANDPSALVQYFQTSPTNAAQSDQSGTPSSQTPNPSSDTSPGTVQQTSEASLQPAHVDISA